MSESPSFWRKHWRTTLTIVTLGAFAAVTYTLKDQIVETMRNLNNINLWFLLLIVPFQVGFYHFSALMYRGLFEILGHKVSYKFLWRATLELNFVNHVFPSGGVSGFSYFGLVMRKKKITAGKATLVQTMRFILIFIAFQILLFVALFFLALDGKVNNFLLLISGSMATLLVVGTLGLMYIVGSEKRIDGFFTFVTMVLNKIIQIVRPKEPETIRIDKAKQVFKEYHVNYEILRGNYKLLRMPLTSAFMINLMEVLTVYAVFLAFGQWVNIGAVIIAYAVANFAGLISVIPGGVGIYEGLMAAVLAIGGVPAAISLPVIITYRVLTIFLQVPVGGLLYYRRIHGDD